MSYNNLSSTPDYPKTLVIRNSVGGMIWQIYHVEAEYEVDRISATATSNGFYGITLEDYQPEEEETFPTWRDDSPWLKKENIKKSL